MLSNKEVISSHNNDRSQFVSDDNVGNNDDDEEDIDNKAHELDRNTAHVRRL